MHSVKKRFESSTTSPTGTTRVEVRIDDDAQGITFRCDPNHAMKRADAEAMARYILNGLGIAAALPGPATTARRTSNFKSGPGGP